jgi:hypothetical protein
MHYNRFSNSMANRLYNLLSLALGLSYLLGYLIWKTCFILGCVLQAIGFRYSKSLQFFAVYLILVPSIFRLIHLFCDALVLFIDRNLPREQLRRKKAPDEIYIVRSLFILVLVTFLGIFCPMSILYDSKEWIWQENMLVSIIGGLAIIGLGIFFSAQSAEWMSSDGRFIRSATRSESLSAFGRNWIMVVIGIVAAALSYKELLVFTKNDILVLSHVLRKLF